MSIRRIIYFRARGNRLNDFVNAVRRSDIRCYSQRYMNEEYTGQIYYSDLDKMNILAGEYNTELTIDGYAGTAYRVFRYKKRYGFFVGIVVLVFFISFFSNTVVKIEVNGNNSIAKEQILSTLAESGLKKGKYIPSINLEKCQNELQLKQKNIGWTSIRRSGCRIVVDIHEIGDTPSTVKSNIPCNIISTRDAIIVSVLAKDGVCRVSKGDAVSKGEIIISGVITNNPDTYRIVHAQGSVVGEYYENHKFTQFFTGKEKKYYSEKRRNYFEFFGFKIPLFLGSTENMNTDYSENTQYFSVFGTELPIGITSADYKYFRWDEVEYDIEQASVKIDEQIALFEKNFYNNCKIAGKNIIKNKFEDRMECEVEYIIHGNIATEGNLFSEKPSFEPSHPVTTDRPDSAQTDQ